MRIAFVSDCYWPRVNGVTVSMQTFRDRLETLGHRTLILAPEYPGAEPDPAEPPVRRFRSASARLEISHDEFLRFLGAGFGRQPEYPGALAR